jgi:hypothetical protein
MIVGRRVPLSWVLIAAMAVAVIANLLLSNRPPQGYTMYQIEEIATLPDTPELADVRRYTEIGAGELPHLRGARRVDIDDQPLRVGWVYQESGILSLPYWAENISTGPSLYIDTGDGYRIAGVTPGQIPLLEQKVGRPILRDYQFRWYRHIWGWGFPLALALLIWLWVREARAREEASWAAEQG